MNKFDLIIDVLELIEDIGEWKTEDLDNALAAARELKALQPVAWLTVEGLETTSEKLTISISMQKQINGTPLYALEVTK